MFKNMYINLPAKELDKSKAFYEAVGFTFSDKHSNDNSRGFMIGDGHFLMLHNHALFHDYSKNPIGDMQKETHAIVTLDVSSVGEVDALVQKAVAAGGEPFNEARDYGFMYAHGFKDPDGHIWEIMCIKG